MFLDCAPTFKHSPIMNIVLEDHVCTWEQAEHLRRIGFWKPNTPEEIKQTDWVVMGVAKTSRLGQTMRSFQAHLLYTAADMAAAIGPDVSILKNWTKEPGVYLASILIKIIEAGHDDISSINKRFLNHRNKADREWLS